MKNIFFSLQLVLVSFFNITLEIYALKILIKFKGKKTIRITLIINIKKIFIFFNYKDKD